jgi:pilus assembly protein Flp/PilA
LQFFKAALQRTWRIEMKMLRKLWQEDDGQDLAEYGLLLALIAVALVIGIGLFKDQIVAAFSRATSALAS